MNNTALHIMGELILRIALAVSDWWETLYDYR
jgi:hypothetical protein